MRGGLVGWRSFLLAFSCFLSQYGPAVAGRPGVLLATTTSTANTGLLDEILPAFEAETGIRVRYVAVGTGAALRLGMNGDADAVLAHDPEAEEAFVRAGHGIARIPVMWNDFVILGPPDDPAGIASERTAAGAFRRIAARGARFVSRGDGSGTHLKELALWRHAGAVPTGRFYAEAGQGMGACLVIADESGSYILSDRATFLARGDSLRLGVLFEGDPVLTNPYSIIAVAPERRPGGNPHGARRLIEWLTSSEGQRRIAEFRANGHRLFHPVVAREAAR
jgi:tungstate transport system substrate-binding protein